MKKVVLITICFILGIFIYSNIKLNEIKIDNQQLKDEIKKIENNNKKIEEDNLSYKEEISNIKEQNKDKWEELEIWNKAKSKLEKALSS